MFTIGLNVTGAHTRVSVIKEHKLFDQIIEVKQPGIDQLFTVIDRLFSKHNLTWSQAEAIGVATGPGNFNGIRLGISAARGLALALNIPAIGVSIFDAISYGQSQDLMVVIKSVKDKYFCRVGTKGAPIVGDRATLMSFNTQNLNIIGFHSDQLAQAMGVKQVSAKYETSLAIALQADKLKMSNPPLPKPLYISQPRVDPKAKTLQRNQQLKFSSKELFPTKK